MTSARLFKPRLPSGAARRLVALLEEKTGRALLQVLRDGAEGAEAQGGVSALEEAAVFRLLADLTAIGWQFRVVRSNIYMIPQRLKDGDPAAAKALLREALSGTRNQQLSDPSTIAFFRQMHAPKGGTPPNSPIDLLIEDGRRLAHDLLGVRDGDLSTVVRPYLQFADAKARCSHTGLPLNDIWRYFRHTWSLEFRPTPGRNLNYLIRNAARPNHPIIGIVGLTNAVFQLTTRDEWVGWTEVQVVKRALATSGAWRSFLETAIRSLQSARAAIRSDDLMRTMGKPKTLLEISRGLARLADAQTEVRNQSLRDRHAADEDTISSPRLVPRKKDGSTDWKAASETPLFTRKRAETLAAICFALHHLQKAPNDDTSIRRIVSLVMKPDGEEARWKDEDLGRSVRTAVREIKKNGVASRILDVNVCGASPTYREILGGKLAAMSLFASEVQDIYLDRYATSAAEIASAMAGRPICKRAHVCALTTTSLYEVGSSQYNRVRVRFGERTLEWSRIGETEGFGAIHFSKATIEAVRKLAVERRGMRNVNNVFGEGTSPLMRQMREGLSLLGFEPNDVLQHTHKRIVYAAEVYPEAREDLISDRDTYSRGPSFAEIAADWQERWLRMRAAKDPILNRVAQASAESVKREFGILPAVAC